MQSCVFIFEFLKDIDQVLRISWNHEMIVLNEILIYPVIKSLKENHFNNTNRYTTLLIYYVMIYRELLYAKWLPVLYTGTFVYVLTFDFLQTGI